MIDYILRVDNAKFEARSLDECGDTILTIGAQDSILSAEEVDALIDFLTKHKTK